MFSLNWFLGLIPQWVPWAIIGIGVALFILVQFLQYLIPVVYRAVTVIAIELLSLFLFGFGFYIDGRQDVIINSEKEIAQAVSGQKDITDKVKNDLEKKLKEAKSNNAKIIQYINTKDDGLCKLPSSFISVLNYAAKDSVPESSRGTDATNSGFRNSTRK
jgi:cell division protein FtsB